ncbi:sigma-54-dependent transcriptional regulator [Litoribrevibacter albus]|uniref:Type 4 fimbriae expression regulatory protein PilR n=1 Tax=Litoribrevibacter albus TaxID=1473156 RepID=A0AA37W8A8_9GAMM|nr:sigma-54 dependent transcriptional regulator [Litoribrevibacter albus]GLQ33672.1 type 4 fimbriae expression regulatory protein PilR [Litoribrevibacter albus]
MNQHVLIIDDEPDIRELLDITLMRMGLDATLAENVQQAKEHLQAQSFDLCLTDMNLPDGNGIDLVAHIQEHYPDTPVAVITAYGSMETAITALKAGAFDFVSKPIDLKHLRDLVQSALKLPSSEKNTKTLKHVTQEPTAATSKILGESKAVQLLRKQVAKLARSQAPVYIHGESGSGKELAAKLIHDLGPRSEGPFIAVNCGAIPSELMESEFFGHKKGAFTGATENKEGFFQAANGGTLFLDEVADLPLAMQVKLLRALQEKSVRPVGEQKEISIDVRILSATHKDLSAEVDLGHFRQDLFYRINVINLNVPSLRERQEDITLLASYMLDKIASEWQMDQIELDPSAMAELQNYPFPGNIRELQNILERAYTLCEDDVIRVEDLQLPTTKSKTMNDASEVDITEIESLDHYLESIEKKAIQQALEETRWNKTAAAKRLGITFRALRYKLKKLEME